jgi:hypothetical protein
MKKLFDFWSIPHFLFGVLMAMVAAVFFLPPVAVFCAVFVVAVSWELLEMKFKLRESRWNVASDVMLPLLAFPITFFFVERPTLSQEHRVAMMVVVILIYVYANAIAWQARFDQDQDFMG